MRQLFISEQRYIRNMLLRYFNVDPVSLGQVLIEQHYPPITHHPRRHFNIDYMLQFANDLETFASCSSTILPNTLGADVFVTFDKRTSRLLRTELLSGDAFSIDYFSCYVNEINKDLDRLSQPVNLRSCCYCRIFVIENDICFLAFPDHSAPVGRGKKCVLRSDAGASIEYAIEGDRLIYVDGWIRTQVVRSDRQLVAIPKNAPDGDGI